MAMNRLGNGLHGAGHNEEALSVGEAEMSMLRRLGDTENNLLIAQSNLANTYEMVGRLEDVLRLKRDVYSGFLKLYGDEHITTLRAAHNYANSLLDLKRFEEAKVLMCKTIPVSRRVLGESMELTLAMRTNYAMALYEDDGATLDDLREAVTSMAETAPIARRVFDAAHPATLCHEGALRNARAALRARETPPPAGSG